MKQVIYAGLISEFTKTITENASNKTTTTKHNYVPSGNGVGQTESVELSVQGLLVHKQDFDYNNKHQLISVTDSYDGQTVTFSNTYDDLWRPLTSTSPSGFTTTNQYNDYGDLEKILSGNTIIWQGNEQNSKGQFKNYTLGNGLITTRSYSDRGELEGIRTYLPSSTTNIQHNAYTYFDKTGNLKTRNDVKNNRNEVFEYDELDRLTKAWLNGTLIDDMTYHPNGNINTKSDVGTYRYTTPRPHAMSGIDNAGESITNQKQFIEYTAFNKVSRITQGINEQNINRAYDIFYGLDEQRIKTVYDDFSISGHIKTRYYFGSYEKDIDEFGNVTETDYLYTPVGLTAMQRKTSAGANLYYIHTDLLGSIQAISNASGVLQAEYTYTPWGGRITLTSPLVGDLGGFDRGYTGHEHLSPFGDDSNGGFCLINMNGRIYDPVLARFLSPDPYVQAPDFTQSFNRYAYCWNNPFRYTDPSGEWVYVVAAVAGGAINLIANWHDGITIGEGLAYFAIGAVSGVGAVAAPSSAHYIAAGASALNNLTRQSFQPDGSIDFNNVSWKQVAYSGIIGGATSYVGGLFGQALGADKWFTGIDSPLLQNVLRNVTSNTIVGGTIGGMMTVADGGDFFEGFGNGAKMGLVTGTVSGIAGAVMYSKQNNVNLFTGKSNTVKQTGNYTVYRGIDPDTGETKYIGITERDPQIRFNEHQNSNSPRSNLDYAPIEGATNLSKIDARIMEQNYINQYRMIKNGGVLYNQRNSIAPKFWDIYNIKR